MVGLGTVKDMIRVAWKAAGEVDVKNIGFNLFNFTFKSPNEANRILKETPWVVRNSMLSLQKRKPYLSDNEIIINTCEFWVQFYNVPLEGRMEENITLMAEAVGRVIEIENPEDERYVNRNFGRARVEINIEKPLVPGFLALRPGDLEDVWIQVKYEKLVRYCFNCGKMGHESKGCEEETVEFAVNGGTKGYDAGLCTQQYREQGNFPMHRRQGRPPEMGEMHGEEGGINWKYTREWAKHGEMENRVLSSQMKEQEGGPTTLTRKTQELPKSSRDHEEKKELLFNNNIFVNNGFKWGMDSIPTAQKEGMARTDSGLKELIKEMDGSLNMLKARKEQLLRTQPKYWVELAEEEDESINSLGAIVPYQFAAVGEIEKGIRDVSLKRKAVESPEEPMEKRRKDHKQDSPKSAGDHGMAEAELRKIEEIEGADPFGFRYDGNNTFSHGYGFDNRRGVKGLEKHYFWIYPQYLRLYTEGMIQGMMWEWETEKISVVMIAQKGVVAGLIQPPRDYDVLGMELSGVGDYPDSSEFEVPMWEDET